MRIRPHVMFVAGLEGRVTSIPYDGAVNVILDRSSRWARAMTFNVTEVELLPGEPA